MNGNASLEDRLESLGAALRAPPGVAGRVMDEVRASVLERPSAEERPHRLPMKSGRRRRLFAVSGLTAAAIAALLLVTISLFPSRSVGWTEVSAAIKACKWIRGVTTHADGTRGTLWLAPERRIWAYVLNRSYYFNDGQQKAKYEYQAGNPAIIKLPLGEDDARRVLPIDALSEDQTAIGSWLFGEKIVDQQRRVVTDDGKTWIDFQLVFARGAMNHATLRVDPQTRLPVYLLSTSPNAQAVKCVFDYPDDGPTDIYALGAPRDTRIDDRTPSDNAVRVLEAMAASRARMGDFRMIVVQSPEFPSSIVYRKANRWRVDTWRPQHAVDAAPEVPTELDAKKWLEQSRHDATILFICDGNRVWENGSFLPGEMPRWTVSKHPAPQDLMSGEGLGMLSKAPGAKLASLLFPDLTPKAGWSFEFDANPAEAPGCVLFKRSAKVTWPQGAVGHEWYYVEAAKGYAVVRAELFNSTPDGPDKPEAVPIRQTIRMKAFQQSPQGFWYPAIVHDTRPIATLDAPPNAGAVQQFMTTAYYVFEFDVELPDTLFEIEGAPVPEK